MIKSFKTSSLTAGIVGIILSISLLIMNLVFIGDIKTLEFFKFLALYILGFVRILAGLSGLISGKELKQKLLGLWAL